MTEHRHGQDRGISRTGFILGAGFSEETHQREFHLRLQRVTQNLTYRELSYRTGVHAETVRRYIRGGKASPFFVAALCKSLGINSDWLLLGRGDPEYTEPVRLGELAVSELLECLAVRQAQIEQEAGQSNRARRRETKPMTNLSVVQRGTADLQE